MMKTVTKFIKEDCRVDVNCTELNGMCEVITTNGERSPIVVDVKPNTVGTMVGLMLQEKEKQEFNSIKDVWVNKTIKEVRYRSNGFADCTKELINITDEDVNAIYQTYINGYQLRQQVLCDSDFESNVRVGNIFVFGDIDTISDNVIIDYKCSKYQAPSKDNWLQILAYLELYASKHILHNLSKLVFINPVCNVAYILPISRIPNEYRSQMRCDLCI